MSILLIHPPVVKPCEPPAGIARLAGALQSHRIPHTILDANLESILWLMQDSPTLSDTWTVRAFRNRSRNLVAIKTQKTYENKDRYKRTVKDINRTLQTAAQSEGIRISLTNYENKDLSPVRSSDLVTAFEQPARNPFYPYFQERLSLILAENQPEFIGFSLNYLSQALCTFAMIGFLKSICPAAKIILGGGLVTSWMRNPLWKNPFSGIVDYMIDGAGEAPLLSLFAQEPSSCHIAPDYNAFPLSDYLSPGFVLPYSASQGCHWQRCSFCPERAEGNRYIPLSCRQVTTDLQLLSNKNPPALIHLLDNAVSPALLNALVRNPPGIPWYGFTRISDMFADLDFCIALKRSGCVMLKLGVESGSRKVLDSMQKGIDLKTVSTTLKNLHQAGIATYVYLLFGTPSETLAEALQTLDFTLRHSAEIGFLNLAIFNLPVYGPDTANLESIPFYDGDLSLYRQFRHPHGWDRKAVRQFLDKEFRRQPAIAAIVHRDPPFFSSNHAPFFCMENIR